jgi:hypothetical protein
MYREQTDLRTGLATSDHTARMDSKTKKYSVYAETALDGSETAQVKLMFQQAAAGFSALPAHPRRAYCLA